MKKVLVLLLMLLSLGQGYAQSVAGRLVDEKQQPVAYGNVKLERPDSTFVTGGVTDGNGKFLLSAPEAGDYLLVASYMGYVTSIIRLDNLNRKTDLGEIILYEASQQLGEVTVSAARVVAKLDRQVILPSETQLKSSSSGYDLLGKLMLPGIQVSSIHNTVSTVGGGGVELRINDIKATQAQVQALRPASVIRVEYIDNPGIRYADSGVEAVINYIVKRQDSGISGGVNLMNAVTTGFGNDNVYVKANHKRSEFGLNYYLSYRDYDDRYVDEDQTFAVPDNQSRYRYLEGVSVPFGYDSHELEASYNFTETDKYVFNAVFRGSFFRSPHQDYSQIIHETDKADLQSYVWSNTDFNSPSLDLYYQIVLPRKQKLSVNVVGTYIGTTYHRDYSEWQLPERTQLSEYGYSTDGNRYSLIEEAIYNKELSWTNLSVGFQGTQAFTKNIYTGSTNENARMHSSNFYGYTQIQGKLKKLNYMLGAGVSRQYYDESGEGYSYVSFRPSVSLSYPVFKGATLRYLFSSSPYQPSLAALSDIPRQLTDIEMERGNADLQPYRSYNNRVQLNWGNKLFTTQLSGGYLYYKNPIMSEVSRVDQTDGSYMFVYAVDNQKSFSRWNGQLYVKMNVIPDRLTLSGYGGVGSYNSEGNSYSHHYTSWYGGGSASFDYKDFSLSGEISTRYNSFYGESVSFGENNSSLMCSYKIKSVRLGVGVLYPFTSTGWSAGDKLVSDLVKKERWTYIKDNGNMLFFSLNWDFNYGRKYKAGVKTLNNSDSDSGIAR